MSLGAKGWNLKIRRQGVAKHVHATVLELLYLETMKDLQEKQELPSWHRKSQRAYRINRIVVILQMVAAFVLAGVIWFGVERVVGN